MSRTRISQREARQLRKRVDELVGVLERQRAIWSQEYIGGAEIARTTWQPLEAIPVAVRTARKLRHAVVVVGDDGGTVRFVALPLAAPGEQS